MIEGLEARGRQKGIWFFTWHMKRGLYSEYESYPQSGDFFEVLLAE